MCFGSEVTISPWLRLWSYHRKSKPSREELWSSKLINGHTLYLRHTISPLHDFRKKKKGLSTLAMHKPQPTEMVGRATILSTMEEVGTGQQ